MPSEDDAPLSAAEMLGETTSGDILLEAAIEAVEGPDEDALRAEGIDPNHPVLSIEEQRKAIADAKARVLSDSKKEAVKALEKTAYESLRGKAGMRTGDVVRDEEVWITLDLAEHSDRIVLSGVTYLHGQSYKVPRHVADTLREIQSRGHGHQNDIEGKGLSERMRRPQNKIVSATKGVFNGAAA